MLSRSSVGILGLQAGVDVKVYGGDLYFSHSVAQKLVFSKSTGPSLSSLTEKEFEILKLTGDGKSPNEIAEALHISYKTVSAHKTNIMKKLRLNDAVALARFAILNGISISE